MSFMTETTCQICGRLIKAKKGLIAHHGYQRPGHGWQTSSCFGARWRPYEVACDALPPAIKSLIGYIENTAQNLTRWKDEPPKGIEARSRGIYRNDPERSILKPAGFDPATARPDYKQNSYVSLYNTKIAELENNIKHASHDLEALKTRLADWKTP